MMIADNLIVVMTTSASWRPAGGCSRQGPARHPRQGRRPVLPDRLPDGGRPGGLPPPELPARHYVIRKLIKFSNDHDIDCTQVMRDLDAAVAQTSPVGASRGGGAAGRGTGAVRTKRGAGPQRLGEILPAVLAKLGVELVQSNGVRGG